MTRRAEALAALCLAAPLAAACGPTFDGSAAPPPEHRVVTGRLVPPTQAELSRQPVALQLAAVSIDARESEPVRSFEVSRAFSPAANGGRPVSFSLALPYERSYVLVLQVPVDGAPRLGQLVARLRFPRSASGEIGDVLSGRAPGVDGPMSDLDLGTVKITSLAPSNPDDGLDPRLRNVVLLGEGEAANPLAINDADGDGTPDLDDADDDDDLIPDSGDDDANGDGVPDGMQGFSALAGFDADGDGIPDAFDP
jgi:hypothetical protein